MGLADFVRNQCAKPTGTAGEAAAFLMSCGNRRQYRAVEDGLAFLRAGNVLDIGFGSGRLTGELARKKPGCVLYGAEISQDMLDSARRRNAGWVGSGKMFLRLGDAAALPYRDGFFQAAYTVNTVYFWREPEICLREIHRVLSPGGLFLNAFYHQAFLESLPYTNRGFQKYAPRDLLELTRGAGFSSVVLRELKPGRAYCLAARK